MNKLIATIVTYLLAFMATAQAAIVYPSLVADDPSEGWNNTQAIQNAAVSGNTVILPPGTYYIDGSWSGASVAVSISNQSNVQIIGDNTVLFCPSVKHAIQFANCSNLTLRDIWLTTPNANDNPAAQFLAALNSTAGGEAREFPMLIRIEGGDNVKLLSNILYGAYNWAVQVTGSATNVEIGNNTISYSVGDGIHVASATNVSIHDNYLNQLGDDAIAITDHETDGGNKPRYVTIRDNHIYDSKKRGIYVVGCKDIYIIRNDIHDTEWEGISVNEIADVESAVNGQGYQPLTETLGIWENTIERTTTYHHLGTETNPNDSSNRAGMRVYYTRACTIDNNDISGANGYGIMFAGYYGLQISNNDIVGCNSSGIKLLAHPNHYVGIYSHPNNGGIYPEYRPNYFLDVWTNRISNQWDRNQNAIDLGIQKAWGGSGYPGDIDYVFYNTEVSGNTVTNCVNSGISYIFTDRYNEMTITGNSSSDSGTNINHGSGLSPNFSGNNPN